MNNAFLRIFIISTAAAAFAHAAEIDFGGGGCGDPVISNVIFNFNTSPTTGVLCDTFTFDLPDGAGVGGMTITTDTSAGSNHSDYNCDAVLTPIFTSCYWFITDRTVTFLFTGGTVPWGGAATLDLTGFSTPGTGPGQAFTMTIDTVAPEPGSMLLLAGGVAAMLAAGKRQASRTTLTPAGTRAKASPEGAVNPKSKYSFCQPCES